MLFELLLDLLIIIIVCILIIILSKIHIRVLLQNNNLECNGKIIIKYLFLNLNYNIQQLLIESSNKSEKSEDIDNKNISDKNNDNTTDTSDEKQENKKDELKIILKQVLNAKNEILKIISYLPKLVKFKNSTIKLDMGLADDELTLKIAGMIYSIGAILYPAGLKIELRPVYNDFKIKSDVNLSVDIITFKGLILLFKIIREPKLRKLIKILINYAR